MFSFIPNKMYDSICDLTPETLRSLGVRTLFMDFDNTIVPYTNDIPTPEVEAWFASMKDAGITLCVVSNTKRGRAIRFCEDKGILCVTHSQKPFPKGIRRAMELCHATEETTALVGDQIYTDILGANNADIISILIKPLHLHNIWLKLRHIAELPWIYIGRSRGK